MSRKSGRHDASVHASSLDTLCLFRCPTPCCCLKVEMDQILKANELSIQLVAAVPAFLIAGGSLYWLGR